MQIQYELLRTTSKQIFESYMWYLRQIKNSWKISPYNNLISYLNSFLENCSNSQCQCTSFQMIWCLSICLSWLVEREELHFWLVLHKTWNISRAQFVLLFNFHSWWSKMGESSFNVYYILCDVCLSWLTYLQL